MFDVFRDDLDPEAPPDPRAGDVGVGTIHPLTGPVHIEATVSQRSI